MLKGIGVDWYAYPLWIQRGAACLKIPEIGWSIEENIPIFKGEEGRDFIERYIYVNEQK